MTETTHFWISWLLLAAGLFVWARCDTVVPEVEPLLVVEGFADAGEPLPAVRLWQSQPLDVPYSFGDGTSVSDADVTLTVDGRAVPYVADAERPGTYVPGDPTRVTPPHAVLTLEATWGTRRAEATSTVPPPVRLDSVRVDVPEAPVDGIILDSLFLDPARIDSLQFDSLSTGAREGLVYLVEVTLWWSAPPGVPRDSLYWIRAQLKPLLPSRPTFDDFFFRPDQIVREEQTAWKTGRIHTWTGVYAVPVATVDEPLPAHELRVAVVRSGQDYARFASSRDDPQRREPVTNVRGGVGIFAGLSIDSLRVRVE